MSQFINQVFSSGELLTASKLDQIYRNMDLVRRSHAGMSAPYAPELGTWWLNTTGREWSLNVYDGAAWVTILIVDPFDNAAYIPSGQLRGGIVSSGSLIGDYFADSSVTDLITRQNLIQPGDNKLASGAITHGKIKTGSVQSIHVSSGAALKPNIQDSAISEDQVAYGLVSLSGSTSGLDVSMNAYSHAPCISQSSGDESNPFIVGCRTGTASASTPGFRISRSGSAGYSITYRYYLES